MRRQSSSCRERTFAGRRPCFNQCGTVSGRQGRASRAPAPSGS
jgi:hypothetical protein